MADTKRFQLTAQQWKMAIVGILCLIIPIVVPGYRLITVSLAGIYMIVAVGMQILLGFTGQISIGHAAFLCIGAYTSALLSMHLHWSFWITVPLAGVVATVVGLILGLPALRLHGHYLAIATLGFGVAITQVLTVMEWTGGYSGLMPPPFKLFGQPTDTFSTVNLLGLKINGDQAKYFIILLFVVVAFILASNIMKSRTGRAFMAIRDSEIAAQAMGVSIAKYKVISFGLSAFFTGIAGGLYPHLQEFVSVPEFNLGVSLNFFAMIVIGGMGSLWGAVYGAIFMTLIPILFEGVQHLPTVLMGVAIILVTLFLPGGIATLEAKLFGLFRRPKPNSLQMSKRSDN